MRLAGQNLVMIMHRNPRSSRIQESSGLIEIHEPLLVNLGYEAASVAVSGLSVNASLLDLYS